MSPDIRWRNGGPLMLPGGVVGGSEKCCCDNPPPPACVCPDFCSYFIEVVEPCASIKNQPKPCGNYESSDTSSSSTTDIPAPDGSFQLVTDANPVQFLDPPSCDNSVRFYGGTETSARYIEAVSSRVATFIETGVFDPRVFRAVVGSSLRIACYNGIYNIRLGFYLSAMRARLLGYGAPFTELLFSIQKTYFTDEQDPSAVSTYCARLRSRACDLDPVDRPWLQYRFLNTPIAVTASSETTSLGPYNFSSSLVNSYGGWAQSILDAVAPVKFSVTSRPSCYSNSCSCNPLDGRVILFGAFVFTLGTPSTSYATDAFVDTYEYAGGLGNALEPYVFVFTRYDLNQQFLYELQNIELWCDADNSSSPVVNRWYVIHTTDCFARDENNALTGWSFDRWTGHFTCYDPDGNEDTAADGEGVPMGPPDMLRDPDHPVIIQGDGCEPPALKTFRFR